MQMPAGRSLSPRRVAMTVMETMDVVDLGSDVLSRIPGNVEAAPWWLCRASSAGAVNPLQLASTRPPFACPDSGVI